MDTHPAMFVVDTSEDVFIQLPTTKEPDPLQPVTLEEIQQHTMRDKDLLLLTLWIQGNEVQTKDNSSLFDWFLSRQSRLAISNNVIYLCDRPTNIAKSIQPETARILVPSTLQQRIITY